MKALPSDASSLAVWFAALHAFARSDFHGQESGATSHDVREN
jgi:hypothetical protein